MLKTLLFAYLYLWYLEQSSQLTYFSLLMPNILSLCGEIIIWSSADFVSSPTCKKQLYRNYYDIYGRLAAPDTPVPVVVGTCTLPSEVCQWTPERLRESLGERDVLRWDQNWALWHQLDSFGGREMLTLTPRTSFPLPSTEVETPCFGTVSLYGTILRWTGPCTMKSWGEKPPTMSRTTENGSWIGLPASQWLKTCSEGNKGVTAEEYIKVTEWSSQSSDLNPIETLTRELELRVTRRLALKPHGFGEGL